MFCLMRDSTLGIVLSSSCIFCMVLVQRGRLALRLFVVFVSDALEVPAVLVSFELLSLATDRPKLEHTEYVISH